MHHASARPTDSADPTPVTERRTPWAVVVTGSTVAPPAHAFDDVLGATIVIAADSGLAHLLGAGRDVDLVVGDLDSVSDDDLGEALAAGAAVERHPVDKEATDLALAIRAARHRGARAVTVLDGGGGRHDHLLANALLLGAAEFADLELDGWVGDARIAVVRTERILAGSPGSWCSLLPLGGPAHGVTTTGLRYPLQGETLEPGTTRGVSNEFVQSTATVELTAGTLLAVQPDGATTTTQTEA